MKILPLLASLLFATVAIADPAGQLRELDRLFKEGRISKTEYDQRWRDIVSENTNPPSVPRITLERVKPAHPRNELSFSGGAAGIDVGDSTELLYAGTVMLGRFVTPGLQLSIGADYGRADLDDATFTSMGPLGSIDYHFNTSSVFVPYVGIGAAWTNVEIDETDDSDWCWNAHVGIKQYVAPDTALKYQITYFDHADFDIRGLGVSLGLCFLF